MLYLNKLNSKGINYERHIKNYFNQMEAAAFASDYADQDKGYRKYLDLDSFLKNFIVGEFGGNTDTYWSV